MILSRMQKLLRARRILKRKIQQGAHDSVADARAAMELTLLRLKNGPSLENGRSNGRKLPEAISMNGKRRKCCFVDRPQAVKRYLVGEASGIAADDDEEAVRGVFSFLVFLFLVFF